MDVEKFQIEPNKITKLNSIIDKYKNQQGMLITILKNSQDIFGYLPLNVQSYISYKLNIPISKINGIVSFYSLFSQTPKGKYTVSVCLGTACYVKGAEEILKSIKKELQIDVGETTMDGMFTLNATRCIGACGLAPVITINDKVYGRLSPSDIPNILYQYLDDNKKSQLSKEMKQ